MALQYHPSSLLSLQFNVNEIASAYTVGKAVGSIFTRQNDAGIFPPIEKQYGIFTRLLPDHLVDVTFGRRGTVLGGNQRKVAVPNTLPDVNMSNVTGIATFLILVLKYVETPLDTVDYIQQLLKGDFSIVCGGLLESRDDTPAVATLPYAVRQPLRAYVSAILDSDADSEQHRSCLQWLSELTALVGRASNFTTASRYSKTENRRFIKALLSISQKRNALMPIQHNTLCTGTAMIALAALANGANISVTCVLDNEEKITIPKRTRQRTNEKPLSVTLWLTEPPAEIAVSMKVAVSSLGHDSDHAAFHRMMIRGGDAEISRVIKRKFDCGIPDDEALLLWQQGLHIGEQVIWEVHRARTSGQRIYLIISPTCLKTETDAVTDSLAKSLAKKWFSGPPHAVLNDLAHRAALAIHHVYNYADYSTMADEKAKALMNFTLVSFTIGCLKKLISGSPTKLSSFDMSFEKFDSAYAYHSVLGLVCDRICSVGLTVGQLMYVVGAVWGGLPMEAGLNDLPELDALVGIVCPETTILLEILRDPTIIAEYGIEKGIMSLHQGSTPIIPRDPESGFIIAGNPNINQTFLAIGQADFNRSAWPVEKRDHTPDAKIIFTIEPYLQKNGSLSAIMCGWLFGDVAFQFDPTMVFRNLVHRRKLKLADRGLAAPRPPTTASTFVYLGGPKLLELKSLRIDYGFDLIVDVGSRSDWRIAAAGCIFSDDCVLVFEHEEVTRIQSMNAEERFWGNGNCIILCNDP